MSELFENIPIFYPSGFSEEIRKIRYSFTKDETWLESCLRVSSQISKAETPEKQKTYESKFYELLSKNLFVPGGRIWCNSGRNNPQLLNCFALIDQLDSREGWANLARDMIITSMTGGGCGCSFSDVRPNGAVINGNGGFCPGPESLMQLIDNCATPVKAGGGRRVALLFGLDIDHPDILSFIDSKITQGKLVNANISVKCKRTNDFVKAVKEDLDWELSWKGKYKKIIKARQIWNKIVENAYNNAEPGFLNWELIESESNIYYIEKLVITNPCFRGDTLVVTNEGLLPIKDLVGKKVNVFSDGKWVEVDNFRVTARNQQVFKITLQDGSEIVATEYHKFILEDGSRVELRNLKEGDNLKISNPETNGNIVSNGAYLKGFLVGDGCIRGVDTPLLYLYNTKEICMEHLVSSATEIYNGKINTTALTELRFNPDSDNNRWIMTGLAPKKHELSVWCQEYKKHLPSEIYQWDKKSKIEFIAGVMDSDGSVMDTSNGFGYQISSIHEQWLKDFQFLLKTLGVRSKISLNKKECIKDFGDGYGSYMSQNLYRLTISQESSIDLSSMVKFERLKSLADRKIKYQLKPKFNKIISIIPCGVEDEVYCCTIPITHSFTLGNGIETAQCGEIALSSNDCCCLGHIVLHRFVNGNDIDWHQLANAVRLGVRFLDNVLSVNTYPMEQMKEKSHKLRRIGLGTTGLADMLSLLGFRYGSIEGNKFVDKLFRFISKISYEASVMLAIEKGAFPSCDPKKHIESGYMKRMPKKIRALVEEHGIRNCAILTQAPTGSVSILSGNCTSGIEPMFAPAYERWYSDGGERKMELVFHPIFSQFIKENKDISHFVSAHELTVEEHMEVQKIVQKHIDNSVSKTINMPNDYSMDDMSKIWLKYLPFLKGVTFYREGSRSFINPKTGQPEPPPLVAIDLNKAKELYSDNFKSEAAVVSDCPNGYCELK